MSRSTTTRERKLRILIPSEPAFDEIRHRIERLDQVVIITHPDEDHDFALTTKFDAMVERALEAAEDRAAVASHARAAGEERVPLEVARRLVAGESPIRVWREHRKLTLDQLAAAAKLSKSYLSELENGKRKGPVETLRAIAQALRVALDDLA